MAVLAPTPTRGLLRIDGPDQRTFLQGLISNDVTRVTAERALYGSLLTAQGRYLHDFILAELAGALLLDAEAGRLDDLKRRLSLYKLRSKVTIAPAPDLAVAVAWGSGAAAALGLPEEAGAARPFAGGLAVVDPRLPGLGVRLILPAASLAEGLAATGLPAGDLADYDLLRLALGVPDGSRDLPVEKAILLENGFDELNGIDWKKGCYIGQELTARTKYRGLVKKRLLPVEVEGELPAPGTPILHGAEEVGEIRSGRGNRALALLRLEAADRELVAGAARLTAQRPEWLKA